MKTAPSIARLGTLPARQKIGLGLFALAILLSSLHAFGALPAWLHRVPETAIPPFAIWLDTVFNYVKDDLGLLTLTRFLTGGLEFVLDMTGNLLYGKRRWPFLGPIPWSAIAACAAIAGYYLGGWRIAALAGGTFVWTALIGQWDIAMETMSVLIIAVPLAAAIGLILGILAWKAPLFNRLIRPLLAVLQTLPFFTYLLPAVIFFKVGPTAGAVATTVFAIPPMILMTTLGLQKVSSEIVEAGKMNGCTGWQMLRHVYIPAARTEILVGVNQVIMLCLSMVVLTAFIGMPGLGAKLLAMMGSFKIGRSFEIGVTIVLLAITLDRMSKAWVAKLPQHHDRGTPLYSRHRYSVMALVAFVGALALSRVMPILSEIDPQSALSKGTEIDRMIKGLLAIEWIQSATGAVRYVLNVWILIPFRDALLSIPTSAFILIIGAFALTVAGTLQAITVMAFFGLIALSGWWDRSIITLYSVLAAVFIALIIGIPLGIFAARNEVSARRMVLVCDTAQTFPSFIYLIPTIMLFGITATSVVLSILIFSMVPLVRYTIEGLRNVPEELREAADMSGATRRQKLWNVELPLALPTMAVGFNQAIMFAFFMVIIAAFIGTQDLGQELQKTLAGADMGKNFVLGICVSLMALSFDMIIMKWSNTKKKKLGL
jgi:glycine betaine/proline transport system permease protein